MPVATLPPISAPAIADRAPPLPLQLRDGRPPQQSVTQVSLRRPPLKTYAELTETQRLLLGSERQREYETLPRARRAAFCFLTIRAQELGINLSGFRLRRGLEGIRPDRLLLEASAAVIEGLQSELDVGVREGRLIRARPAENRHPGMAAMGVRERRALGALQVGVGPQGVFIDADRCNPSYRRMGFRGAFGLAWLALKGCHLIEILNPSTTDQESVAVGLGADIFSHEEAAVAKSFARPMKSKR